MPDSLPAARMVLVRFCRALGMVAACTTVAGAQVDTTRAASLDSVRVTAERARGSLGSVTSSVTRISGEQLARVPQRSFADILRLVPGFAVVDRDGAGFDAQAIARGFYGGGEAEYVTLLIDGKPVSQLHTGIVAWDVLPPLTSIESVEVLRGNSSALWGDAAVGAIVNVITRKVGSEPRVRFSSLSGTDTPNRLGVSAEQHVLGRPFTIAAALDRFDGFREHSARTAGRLLLGATLHETEVSRVHISTRSHWRQFEEPGFLLQSFSVVRDTSEPLYRFDRTRDYAHALQLDASRSFGSGNMRISTSAYVERRDFNAVNTIALAPGFGDTRERDGETTRMWGSVQLEVEEMYLPWRDRLVVGADFAAGKTGTRWYAVHTGDWSSYSEATGQRLQFPPHGGDATRRNAALFAQYTAQPTSRLQLVAGGRADHISDAYDTRTPNTVLWNEHNAFSPKVGASYRYVMNPRFQGNVFVNATRSFKAPTLDQLFSERRIPTGTSVITTSNQRLDPQFGDGLEAGFYQMLSLGGAGSLLLNVSGYDTRMRDEIDFDIATFQYINIARSRHRGIESQLQYTAPFPLSVFASHTTQVVRAEHGENVGRQLKAIPQQLLTVGMTARVSSLDLGIVHSRTGSAYMDDANLLVIPGYERTDARVRYTISWFFLQAEATNLLDHKYVTTAFPDPAGTGDRYVSPAAGRMLFFGIGFGN